MFELGLFVSKWAKKQLGLVICEYSLSHPPWVVVCEVILNSPLIDLFGIFDASLQVSSGNAVQGPVL